MGLSLTLFVTDWKHLDALPVGDRIRALDEEYRKGEALCDDGTRRTRPRGAPSTTSEWGM
ncbi:hypothetical protein [Streptomyces erythrochromogenes]|uniref:hypothetical protein n=1 Tax=Streptomyces erythrochromogenes TaxID=285574 RepID=UPI0002E2D63A